jgi:hypothetical protein
MSENTNTSPDFDFTFRMERAKPSKEFTDRTLAAIQSVKPQKAESIYFFAGIGIVVVLMLLMNFMQIRTLSSEQEHPKTSHSVYKQSIYAYPYYAINQ